MDEGHWAAEQRKQDTMLPTDPMRRAGSRGLNQAKPIVIEEACLIGGSAVILLERIQQGNKSR